jgi:hypothetical protein
MELLLLLLFYACASAASVFCKDVDVFGAGNVHINQFLKYAITVIVIIIIVISTYLQLEPFLLITFILINLKLLIIFVHNPNVQ